MKKLIYLIVLIAVLGLIVSGCIPVVPPAEQDELGTLPNKSPDYLYVPSVYPTIQAAITAASTGDTIIIAAGEFNLTDLIVVDKSVMLLGAQSNVDPRGGRLGEETILKGGYNKTVFDIKAYDVEINGFKIAGNISDKYVNIIQDNSETFTSSNARVVYNIITNTGTTMNEAVKIRVGTSPLIAYNYIHDIPSPGDAINFDRVTNGVIAFNEVRNSGSENAAIYVYGSLNTTIEGNLVDTTSQNDGIKLGAKGGADAGISGGSILNNVVRNTVQDGISVYMSDVTVEGNEIYNCHSENGAIYLAYAINNIDIHDNDIYNNTLNTGKWGNPAGILIGTAVNASTVTIHNNNIYNNIPNGVTNKATANVVATNNWWGHVSGPSGVEIDPCNTSVVANGSGDKVSSKVCFFPWLAAPSQLDEVGPATLDVAANPNPVPVDVEITLTAEINDTESGGSNIASAKYSLDGGITWVSMIACDGAFDSPVEAVTATIGPFAEPQVIEILVRGTDVASNIGEPGSVLLAVYDPTAGFVTGGGWIMSPAGAYAANTGLTGKATFGFVSKYKKGATVPTGNTEFQFKAGDLNFHSDSYDWLVIAGDKAKYKGTGTINGAGEYGFMLTATDGDPDLFRIKIQNKIDDTVIYDNKMNSDDTEYDGTELGGGQIIVHKGK